MLGVAALGNLIQSYSDAARNVCGIISLILMILLVLKAVLHLDMIKEDLKNPIMASVAATFPMGMMLLSVYAKPYIGGVAQIIWYLAIALHIILIVYFTLNFILKFDMKKVFASYFIVYVGIAAAGITAPAYSMQSVGIITFWFGFISFIILLAVIGYRYLKLKELPEPAQPLFCIFAAPANLCLAAYIQSASPKSIYIIGFLAVSGLALYSVSLFKLISYIKLKFYPSFAAFTFPFVISAIAMKQTMAYLNSTESGIAALSTVVLIQTIIAAAITVYVLIKYCMFLLSE